MMTFYVVGLGLCILAAIVAGLVMGSGLDIKMEQHFSQTKYKSVSERQKMFIKSCASNGINSSKDLKTDSNKQRAELIAEQCEFHDVVDVVCFYDSVVESLRIEEAKKADKEQKKKLTETRRKEKTLLANYTRFSNYVGKEKRIAMLSCIRDDYLSTAKQNRMASRGANQFGNEKEHDWALMGGFASGIAGGAAGLATALEAQADNQRIRANNALMKQTVAPFKQAFDRNALLNEMKAGEIQKQIEQTRLKLISDVLPTDVWKNISVTAKKISVSETGAISVSARFKVKDTSLNYFDDNSAWVVDGTFIAKIYDGEEIIGDAEMVAPLEGIFESKTLNGICLLADEPNKQDYKIKIEPKHLWVMEK